MQRVLNIPHGGGPLPVMGDPAHDKLVEFLKSADSLTSKPSAILIISAHWETADPVITSGATPGLIYDYGGFPPHTYELQYPAPGHPELASKVAALLGKSGFDAQLDPDRGFDHGMFIPLLLMFPDASIPVVQLSILQDFDPTRNINMGRALAPLLADDVLILGSGFTFHNMSAFGAAMAGGPAQDDPQNDAFEEWLSETLTSPELSNDERTERLTNWAEAPGARWAQPREDHLLPLHVCFGAAAAAGITSGTKVFDDKVLTKRCSGYLW